MEVGQSGSLHCSYDPLYRYEPVPEEGTFYLPALPLHGKTTHQDANPQILQGDANGDGKVNAADVVEMINAKKGQPSAKFVLRNADINGDGVITDADITAVVNIILL